MRTARVNLLLLIIAMAAVLVLVAETAQGVPDQPDCRHVKRKDGPKSLCEDCCTKLGYADFYYTGKRLLSTGSCRCGKKPK